MEKMVDMNCDQIFEVPDTPDRIQQSTLPVSGPDARRGIRGAGDNLLPPRRIIVKTRNNCLQSDNMVDMNSDQIFEVPDTPDQMQQPTCPVPGPGARRGIWNMAGNQLRPTRILFKTRNDSIQGQSSRGNASTVLPTPSDTENIFRQAELARLLPVADLEEKPSSQESHRTKEFLKDEKGAEKLGFNQKSSNSNHISYRGTEGRNYCYQIRGDNNQQDSSCNNVDILGVGSDFPTIPVGKPHNIRGASVSNKLKEIVGANICSTSSPRKDNGITISNKNIAGLSSPTPCIVPQRHVGQRKLVRNGCISPSNIVSRSVKVHENREICSSSRVLHCTNPQVDVSEKGNVIDLTDISPTIRKQGNTVNDGSISVNNTEARAVRKFRTGRPWETTIPQATNQNCSGGNNKGKEIVHDVMGAKQNGEANMRDCPSSVTDSSIANNDSTGVSSEQGWRTTHNHTSKFAVPFLSRTTSICGRESGSSGPSIQDNETVARDNNNSIGGANAVRTASLGNRAIMIGRRKRKQISSSCHPGEGSSSLNEPGGPCLLSSNTTAGRRCGDIPVINIDDICSPEVRSRSSSSGYSNGTSVDPNIRAQMESDELLARQLQEQLYNETPAAVPAEEIDAIVALSLQREEEAQRTSRTVRRFQNNSRGARVTRSSAAHRAFRVGYEATNSIQNAAAIALGTRAAYARYPAPHLQANIDLNDYDALLALDENNHQHAGASVNQINNLPQSVVQSHSIEEPCAVCLENPSVGDTIRHLPCFHKFHKECIDEWLRRKKLCPVCKSGIT